MQNNSTWALLAPSPIVWPTKAWNVWLSIAVAIGGIFVAFALPLGYIAYLAVTGSYDLRHPMSNMNATLTSQVLTYLPTAIYLAAVLPALAHVSLPALGFRAPSARTIGIGIAGTVVMYLGVSLTSLAIVAITHHQDTEQAIALLQSLKTPGQKLNFFLVAAVLAPMVEELVFRVFLFNALTRYVSLWPAVVLSGLVFGCVHVIGTQISLGPVLTVALPLAVGGIVLAYVYALTRNYWANVITHGIFNAISVVAVLVFHVK